MLQESATAISLFMTLLVAVTFAKSRFAAFSVGVAGAWQTGVVGGGFAPPAIVGMRISSERTLSM